ncbi:outer membrane protein assembly factor BamB family protein [Cohnella nanjingensis]|uniref:PQQ-binding-like beta-propeller repeat protein n=1 Tax=Cohnella nanjingensis TaxID=1387779 RepID=A0A7X0VHC2_9BACL|nr:PQQ-binding-like beta-propeller repeat protein [Cohnella nanjingensis]MBB6672489.1 PQQ-binding-like beta-propeller repeat protein [Cohnella nanjingensis]
MRRTAWILFAFALLLGMSPQIASAQAQWSLEGAGDITSISVAEDGSRVAIGSHGAKTYVYGSDGRPIFQAAANNVVNAVDLLADGTLLAASDDRHLYAYDASGSKLWDADLKRQVKSMSASRDGGVIALVVQRNNDLLFVDGKNGEQTNAVPIGTSMRFTKVAGNGEWIIVASGDQFVHLLDKTGKTLLRFGAGGQIQAIDISDAGMTAVGTKLGEVELFDAKGKALRKLKTRDMVSAVAFSKDGETVAVSDLSGYFYIFSPNGKKLWETKAGDTGRAVAFDAGGKTLYAGTDDGRVLQFDTGSVVAKAKSDARIRMLVWAIASVAALALIYVLLRMMKKNDKLGVFREIWRSKWVYLGLAPSFLLIFLFLYFPAFSGLFHSLYKWQPGGRTTFIGLDNFRRMIHDPYVTKGLGNLVILIVTGLAKSLIPPLIVAELIYHLRSKRMQYGFRTAFTASMVIPGVAGLLIWQNFYDPNLGLFNNFLELIGLGSWTHGWLGDPKTALWAIIFMGFPFVGILQLLVFYAGLLSISGELIESAKIDGASLPRIIRSIHLPLLAGQFKFLIILGLIGIIQDFNAIMIVTGGGPMDSTYVPALQMYYAATKFSDLGYASALGVSMFAIILVITIVNMKFIKSAED